MDPFKNVEIEYIRSFSKELKTEKFNRFWDENGENIYANNITIIKDELSAEEIVEIVSNEIDYRKKLRKGFCIVEIYNNDIKKILRGINQKVSSIDKFDYMSVETIKYKELNSRSDYSISEVKTNDDYKKLEELSIKDNTSTMGRPYSRYRINRKINAYKDDSNSLKVFLCARDRIAIGSLEFLKHNEFVKIEDFGFLKKYRNQGYGTSFLRDILKHAYENNIKYAYVITDSKDTAKNMYAKCGFKKIGEKTQLIFDL
ncbi:GNAT family N-acetyltransferase [Clostridium sp. LP20]|uniref:GNAT family N-acetyltransferase n=1 Tax=Clostridium sp. LP20 TaxID=3418665 RepID=UPI003EE54AE2